MLQAPKNGARDACDDARSEQRCEARVFARYPGLDNFVQVSALKTAPWQVPVNRLYAKSQHAVYAVPVRFRPLKPAARFATAMGWLAGAIHSTSLTKPKMF